MTQIINNKKQSGAAAIEFALSLMVFLLIFFGLISFGSLMWAQQKLSYGAGEGSRFLFQESLRKSTNLINADGSINNKICQVSLKATGFLEPDTLCTAQTHSSKTESIDSTLSITHCQASVTLHYNTKANALIHSVNWISAAFSSSGSNTMPNTLAAQSTVRIQTGCPEP